MIYGIGIITAGIFILLGLLHLYWAGGSDAANSGVVPEVAGKPLFNPPPFLTILVAIALFSAAVIILARIGYLRSIIPNSLAVYGTWAISLIFFLRVIGDFKYVGLFKKIKDTKFAYWDTWLFSPLCLFISGNTLLLSIGER